MIWKTKFCEFFHWIFLNLFEHILQSFRICIAILYSYYTTMFFCSNIVIYISSTLNWNLLTIFCGVLCVFRQKKIAREASFVENFHSNLHFCFIHYAIHVSPGNLFLEKVLIAIGQFLNPFAQISQHCVRMSIQLDH